MGIQVGTPVTLYNPPQLLANDLVCSNADDRLGLLPCSVSGCYQYYGADIAVYLVASVQEEFNIRGIVPYCRVKPDLALIDITPSCAAPLIYTIIPSQD